MVFSCGRANQHENIPIKRIDAKNMHSYPYIPQVRNTDPHYLLWAPNVPAVVFHTLIHRKNLSSSLKSWHDYQLKLCLLPINFNISLICSPQYSSPEIRIVLIRISLVPCHSQFPVDVDSSLVITGRGLEGCVSSPCWLFKFCLLPGFEFGKLGLKGGVFPCLGVEHSLQLCLVPPHPQQVIFFLSCLGLWNALEEFLLFPFGLNPSCPLDLVGSGLTWLATADIR